MKTLINKNARIHNIKKKTFCRNKVVKLSFEVLSSSNIQIFANFAKNILKKTYLIKQLLGNFEMFQVIFYGCGIILKKKNFQLVFALSFVQNTFSIMKNDKKIYLKKIKYCATKDLF